MTHESSDIKRIEKWYVVNRAFTWEELSDRDEWCKQTFGSYRHDVGRCEGWWLQTEEEYSLFVLRWGINKE